jgi:hypothetical protein
MPNSVVAMSEVQAAAYAVSGCSVLPERQPESTRSAIHAIVSAVSAGCAVGCIT